MTPSFPTRRASALRSASFHDRIHIWNLYVIPVLSYIMCFFPPSKTVTQRVFKAAKCLLDPHRLLPISLRSEEHTSELQSLMRISYAVFCLNKKNSQHHITATCTVELLPILS